MRSYNELEAKLAETKQGSGIIEKILHLIELQTNPEYILLHECYRTEIMASAGWSQEDGDSIRINDIKLVFSEEMDIQNIYTCTKGYII